MAVSPNQAFFLLTTALLCGAMVTQDWNFSGFNIAKDKNTTHGPGTLRGQISGNAVDGNATTCAHTYPAINSYAKWTVDLGGSYTLKGIRIRNREFNISLPQLWDRLQNFTIIGKPSDTVLHDDATSSNKLFNSLFIEVPVNSSKEFDKVTFSIPPHTGYPDYGHSILTLCEVQIYSAMHDCPVIETAPRRVQTIRNGTGYINTARKLVSSGSQIDFNCTDNYSMSGEPSVTCLKNGSYNQSVPQCIDHSITAVGETASSSAVGAVAGGITGAVIVCAVVVLVIVILYKRRKQAGNGGQGQGPVYNNTRGSNFDSANGVYENCNEAHVNEVNSGTVHSKKSETAINVSDLTAVVFSTDSMAERTTKEFQKFPDGMVMPHQSAIKNRSKNRYRNLYAYDDTRVKLGIWDAETDTDYINACYIQGFSKPRAYIASQGPVADILNDFWRMVWQTNSGKIVMLTNLREDGKDKCEQYWPTEGTSAFGRITVTLAHSETYCNFVIRTLIVQKGDEEQRRILQFHFTSWPDRDVPFFPSAFVHFRQKIKASTSPYNGPWIVHCSAGIGRTGTFIAVDYLTEQAKEVGFVDVASCVEKLRRQRVNMVQTKKQYELVHQALVEVLVMKTSAIPTLVFQKSYQDLMTKDMASGQKNLCVEFEILRSLSPKSDISKKADSKDEQYKNKSRNCNIQPDEEYMPSLSQKGLSLFGEFINAVFLPMYKETNAMIITQSPLASTKGDFWKMVYHQNVHTIVMINDASELNSGEIYWPGVKMRIEHGDIAITNEEIEIKSGHTFNTLKLLKSSTERQVRLIQFGGWTTDRSLPDPADILTALNLVQECQYETGNHPFVVHCMDGLTKSGLFCVISALLDRTKLEQDVAISQVIEEMRNRRENIIPNVEQFEFLHEVVQAFLQQFATYSNFTNKSAK